MVETCSSFRLRKRRTEWYVRYDERALGYMQRERERDREIFLDTEDTIYTAEYASTI